MDLHRGRFPPWEAELRTLVLDELRQAMTHQRSKYRSDAVWSRSPHAFIENSAMRLRDEYWEFAKEWYELHNRTSNRPPIEEDWETASRETKILLAQMCKRFCEQRATHRRK